MNCLLHSLLELIQTDITFGVRSAAMDGKQNEIFKIFLELNPLCTILTTLEQGIFVDVNDAFCKNTGYQKEEVIGRSSLDICIWPNPQERENVKQRLIRRKKISLMPAQLRTKSGDLWQVLASGQLVETEEETYWLGIIMDMERQNSLEATLNNREIQLEMLSNKFNDLNLAVRILADAWSKKKADINHRLKKHLDTNVFPFIEKIKQCKNIRDIQAIISIVGNNLKDLSGNISDSGKEFANTFTPLELKILKLVRQGKGSREIAGLLSLTTKSIYYHRGNIRRKLNLVNKKINLEMYLHNQGRSL